MSIWTFLEITSFTCILMSLYLLRKGGDRENRIEAAWATAVGWLAMVTVAFHFHRECERRDSSLRSSIIQNETITEQIAYTPDASPGEWKLTTAGGNTLSWSLDHGVRRFMGTGGYSVGASGTGDCQPTAVDPDGYLPLSTADAGNNGSYRLRAGEPDPSARHEF